MKVVQRGDRGIEIKLSRRNIDQLQSVLDEGSWGMRLTKYIRTDDGELFTLVIGVEGDENHYNEEGVAE